MRSRVTTKQGDEGKTRTLAGTWIDKSDPIIAASGAVDELRAHLALVRQMVLRDRPRDHERVAELLMWLLHACFPIGTECSDPERVHPEYRKGELSDHDLTRLEAEQQWMEDELHLPQSFIAAATNPISAQIDVACTVARRLERDVVAVAARYSKFSSQSILPFLNRLSDTLYVMARYIEWDRHEPVDYGLLGWKSD